MLIARLDKPKDDDGEETELFGEAISQAAWACHRIFECKPSLLSKYFCIKGNPGTRNMILGRAFDSEKSTEDPSIKLFELGASDLNVRPLDLRLPVFEVWMRHCARFILQHTIERQPEDLVLIRWKYWQQFFTMELLTEGLETATVESALRCWWFIEYVTSEKRPMRHLKRKEEENWTPPPLDFPGDFSFLKGSKL
jgi:hypothetical protein